MQRFFIEDENLKPGALGCLPTEICHQVLKVLRMTSGDPLILLDGSGFEFRCEIDIRGKDVYYKVSEKRKNETEPAISVTLYQSLLKSQDKFEIATQKAVELGVTAVAPLRCARCQVSDVRKSDRVRAIMKEASEQSERAVIPELRETVTFEKMMKELDITNKTTNLFFYEGLRTEKFKLPHLNEKTNVIIGPEGGFSEEETKSIKQFCTNNKNSHMLSLGKRVLRSETASIAALSNILINY